MELPEVALTVFAAVVLGTPRLPGPVPDVSIQRIKQVCYVSSAPTVTAPPSPGDAHPAPAVPARSKSVASSAGRKKKGPKKDDSSKDRQRQLVVSHSVLMGLSQSVVNLADDDEDAELAKADEPPPSVLKRLPARLLVERYFLLLLTTLGSVMQSTSETTVNKIRALRCLEVSVLVFYTL